jgi:enterobactin synthetase component D / holo-[acyl-carrier protein] synthase
MPSAPGAARCPAWPSPFPPDVAFAQAEGGPGTAPGTGAGTRPGTAPATAPEAAPPLLAEERALLGSRAAPRRVLEFALGRACAHEALAALAPQRAAELAATPILRDGARRPRWPVGIVGAITHHRGRAAAAVAHAADYLGVGLDLEAPRPVSAALARRILRPEERAAWEALPPEARAQAFLRVFSAKESVFKALYPHTGIYLGFQDATVDVGDDATAAPGTSGVQGLGLRWRLCCACGPGLPEGFSGPGRVLSRQGAVLTAVWLRR